MNNRERQMLKGAKHYFESICWFLLPNEQKEKEFRQMLNVMKRSRGKK